MSEASGAMADLKIPATPDTLTQKFMTAVIAAWW